jgi:hypothetical protein
MRFRQAVAVTVISALGAGCATVDRGAYQRIAVDSEPAGAIVGVDCGSAPHHAKQTTPTVVKVQRKAERCSLFISKDGYEPQRLELRRHLAPDPSNFGVAGAGVWMLDGACCNDSFEVALSIGAIAGGLILGGIGSGIDAASGAMYEQTPDDVFVQLEPEEESAMGE